MCYNKKMNKKIIYLILALLAVAVLFTIIFKQKQGTVYAKDPYNASYVIEGKSVHLVDGVAEVGSGPSSSKTVTRYFGTEARGDVNGDGREDVVFVITQQGPGTGTFYYVVAGLNDEKGYHGTSGYLLGDRIVPQSTVVTGGHVVANYLDRPSDEPLTVQPTLRKSKTVFLDPKTLVFGDAAQPTVSPSPTASPTKKPTTSVKPTASPVAPAQMGAKLVGRKWEWITQNFKDGTISTTSNPASFTVTISSNGTFTGTTDCNQLGGTYSVSGTSFTFRPVVTSKLHCGTTDEERFTQLLNDVRTFKLANNRLTFGLKDGGSISFK
jgi:heat shock protein HslJ